MTKKVAIGARPTATSAPSDVDTWVDHRDAQSTGSGADAPPMKRLTIDIPVDLHRRIKSQCALRGTKIADEVRELLLKKYGKA